MAQTSGPRCLDLACLFVHCCKAASPLHSIWMHLSPSATPPATPALPCSYGPCGEALGLDLLNQPELVSSDPVVAFRTALWFWMTPQSPKPSCHDVMQGRCGISGAAGKCRCREGGCSTGEPGVCSRQERAREEML